MKSPNGETYFKYKVSGTALILIDREMYATDEADAINTVRDCLMFEGYSVTRLTVTCQKVGEEEEVGDEEK